MRPQILLIEDEVGTRFGFVKYLSNAGYDVAEASDLVGARHAVESQIFDAILLDLRFRVGFVQLALGISSPGEVVIRRGVTALRQVQQEIRKRTKGTAALLDAAVRAAIDAGRR